jgi:hypothetical protein
MMQSQGLGALMPQGAQQAPQMNNPRLNAAVDVVSSDAEKQILDPRTLAMLKYKDALQAMQAADQMMAAAQPQPMPPTVAERTKLAAEQGIAGLASRLSPGIQRQGSNMQAQQMQQAMSGGLPQLSAPNMARMAGGGIVAFEAGGRPEDALLTDEQLAAILAARPVDATPNLGYTSDDRKAEAAVKFQARQALADAQRQDEDKRYALASQYGLTRSEIDNIMSREAGERAIGVNLPPELIDLLGVGNVFGGKDTDLEFRMPGTMDRPQVSDVQAAPATVTTAPETATAVSQDIFPEAAALREFASRTANSPPSATMPASAEQSSAATEGLMSILKKTQDQTFDPEAAANARAAELRRLTGADDLIAQRAEAERRRRELAETRFSPEAQRRRALRAGLAGLAERGLGGFSSGAGAEDERIYAEQAAESERSVAEMDRLIADFRQMGMTEFEARNAARTAVQGQEQTQQQLQTDIYESLQRAEGSAADLGFEREKLAAQQAAGRLSDEQALNIAFAEMGQRERQFIAETDARTQVALAEAMRDAIEANADTAEVARIYSSALANAPMGVDPATYARKAVDDFIETYRPTITSGPLVPVNE